MINVCNLHGNKGGVMHKNYQPVLPSTNKLLKKKWDDTYYNEHRRLVKTAKPMVDTSAPKQHPHVISKQKKEQLQRERAEVIDRDNMTLLKKMDCISHRKPGGPGLDHINQYHGRHHSLNLEQRDRTFRRVAKENEATLKRIQQVQPYYKTSQWINDWREKQKLTQLITCYPQGMPTKSTSSMNSVKVSDKDDDEVSLGTGKEQPDNLQADSDLQTNCDLQLGKQSLDSQPKMTTSDLQTGKESSNGQPEMTSDELQTSKESSDGQPKTSSDLQMDHKDDQSTGTPPDQKDDQVTGVNTEE